MKDAILAICAVVGAVLGIGNTVATVIKNIKDKRTKASRNLVKAEFRKGKRDSGLAGYYLYLVNADIRPVSKVDVAFLDKNDEKLRNESIPSLVFGGEYCVDFFGVRLGASHGITSASFEYTDYDGRMHHYKQDSIHQINDR